MIRVKWKRSIKDDFQTKTVGKWIKTGRERNHKMSTRRGTIVRNKPTKQVQKLPTAYKNSFLAGHNPAWLFPPHSPYPSMFALHGLCPNPVTITSQYKWGHTASICVGHQRSGQWECMIVGEGKGRKKLFREESVLKKKFPWSLNGLASHPATPFPMCEKRQEAW